MVCITSCFLAAIFLASMLYFNFMVDKNYINKTLTSTLSKELQDEYKKRILERRSIYMTGFFTGLIISLISLYILRKSIAFGGIPSACFLISLTYIVTLMYYYVTPKLPLFVTLLDKREDRENWNTLYHYMKYNYIASFVFGILFVGILGYGLCK